MAAYFDGTASVGALSSASIASTAQALLHCWVNLRRVGHTSVQYIFTASGVNLWLRVGASTNYLQAGARNGDSQALVNFSSIEPFTLENGWMCIDFVVDTTQAFAKLYLNLALAASVTPSIAATGGQNVDHTSAGNIIGARSGTTDAIVAGIDQVLVANGFTADYVDSTGILLPRYIAEFYDLDPDGVPYRKQSTLVAGAGVEPYILAEDPAATFNSNNGSLGNFTFTGSVSEPDPAVPVCPWIAS
jgi:hypothetical protein